MKRNFNFLGTAGLGALMMYVFDPRSGRRRRAGIRDKITHFRRKAADAIDATGRDLKNRAAGLSAEARKVFTRDPVSDEALANNVRASIRSIVSHPRSIHVSAESGKVTLSGPILAAEVDKLINHVLAMRGVAAVENRLEAHAEAGNIPGLQGEPAVRKSGQLPDVMQANWSPTTRLFAGAFGGSLALYGAKRLNTFGAAVAAAGAAIFARALTNMEFRRLTGVGAGRGAVTVHKITNVAAPVEQVFAFWSDYQNFPRFMSNVRDVRATGEKQSHWVVAGPAGAPVEWDAIITEYIADESIAWETVPGSPIQHTGVIRFEPNADGSTRIDIRMSYNPVAGAVGHAVASIFGADPKTEIEEDLARMKTVIETGKPPHDAARRDQTASTH